MDALSMNKQLIHFQRAVLNTGYESLEIFQRQMENIIFFFQKQIGMPETAQKSMSLWTGAANKIMDDVKGMMDEGFDRIEEFLTPYSDGEKVKPTSGKEIMLHSNPVPVVEQEEVVVPKKADTTPQPPDEKPLTQVVWAAVQEVTKNKKEHVFSPKDVTQIVLKKYPGFHRSTVGCQVISDCVNHTSRHRYPGGEDRYWSLGKGKYRLYDPKKDRP